MVEGLAEKPANDDHDFGWLHRSELTRKQEKVEEAVANVRVRHSDIMKRGAR
jgi:hypothetical protein